MPFGSLLYAKTREETESEETLGFVVIVFIIGGISIGRGVGHLSTPVTRYIHESLPWEIPFVYCLQNFF